MAWIGDGEWSVEITRDFGVALRHTMRCYLIRKGRIENVAVLQDGDDNAVIAEASAVFEAKKEAFGVESFEVWDQARFIYRDPESL